jgi:hypothetical protein
LDRKSFVDQLIYWAGSHDLDLADSILDIIEDEFGNGLTREDRFGTFVSLYGMINIVLEITLQENLSFRLFPKSRDRYLVRNN